MSFVSPVLQCRAANQLTQIIATYAVALKFGIELAIPDKPVINGDRFYWSDYFDKKSLTTKNTLIEGHKKTAHGFVAAFEKLKPSEVFLKEGFELRGFFQSPRYFNDFRSEILELMNFKQNVTEEVAIHYRLGDYLGNRDFQPAPALYFRKAIEHYHSMDLRKFRLFSDSPELAFRSIDDLGLSLDISLAQNNGDDGAVGAFIEMQNCAHHITSISSFSWLAHWFCQSPEKSCTVPAAKFWHTNLDMYEQYSPKMTVL